MMTRYGQNLASPRSEKWRLIPLLDAPGRVQMALDRWLFEQHCLGLHPATLRFYTWQPIALSLGYHQRHLPDAWYHLKWQGSPVEVVRRPSGGRAVLHQGDLTYAVITSAMPARRVEAYERICEFLIRGWQALGISLEYGRATRGYIHNPNCFGTATAADLVLPDGTKLIGSAQLRQGEAILQHGSMRLAPDRELFQQVFGYAVESGILAQERSPLGSRNFNIATIVEALTTAACESFNMELVVQPLSAVEWAAVRALEQSLVDAP